MGSKKSGRREAVQQEMARRAGVAKPEQAAPPATPPAAVPAEPKPATEPEPASKPPAPPSTAPATKPAAPAPTTPTTKPAATARPTEPATEPEPASKSTTATPAPARPTVPAGISKLPPAAAPSGRKPTPSGDHRAGPREYNDFFSLYAQSLGNEGLVFWPLGFIPGPAVLVYGDEVVAATPDVGRGLGKLPCPVTSLPSRVLQSMETWAGLAKALNFQLTGWNLGHARQVLEGKLLFGPVVLGMPRFRYRGGDPEVPFGVVLTPSSGGLQLERMYNPCHIADVPRVGAILKLADLKDRRGPVQKLLRTWALMEANFASRHHRDGSPREPRESRDSR